MTGTVLQVRCLRKRSSSAATQSTVPGPTSIEANERSRYYVLETFRIGSLQIADALAVNFPIGEGNG